MSKRKIILIGGAPLTGKTTLAIELSEKMDIAWVSTDDVRQLLKVLASREAYPGLFDGYDLNADTFYDRFSTAEQVFEQERKQLLDVQKGITALIDNFWWWDTFIIEGVAITPLYAKELIKTYPDITFEATFLVDKNPVNIKQRLYKRGLWGPASTYPDHIKSRELEWVAISNAYYEREAKQHNLTLHDTKDAENLKQIVLDSLHDSPASVANV